MTKSKPHLSSGQSLIEMLVALGIFGIIVIPFFSSLGNLADAQLRYRLRTQATQYVREGMEITYSLSANTKPWQNFTDLADPNKTYYPTNYPTALALIEGEQTLAGERFTRRIILTHAKRNIAGNLDDNGTIIDNKTVKAVCEVFWQHRGQEENIQLESYFVETKKQI